MSFNEEKFRKGLIEYSKNFMKTLLWLKDLGKEEFEKQLTWKLKEYMRQIFNLATKCTKEKPPKPKKLSLSGTKAVKGFIESNLAFDPGSFVTKNEVYKAFEDYCNKEGITYWPAKNTFGRILLQRIPKIRTSKKRIHGKYVYCWRDLKLIIA